MIQVGVIYVTPIPPQVFHGISTGFPQVFHRHCGELLSSTYDTK